MTRDEFMKHAQEEVDAAFRGQRNRMMNLVEQAWAEGKKNAETERVTEIGQNMIDLMMKHFVIPWKPSFEVSDVTNVPDPCKNCPNHPVNGGNGMCNCTLGSPKVTC